MMALDKRQRAMLREMGVRIWQPMPDVAVPATPAIPATPEDPSNKAEFDIDSGAPSTRIHSPATPFNTLQQPVQAPPSAVLAEDTAPVWRVGTAQTLYADTAVLIASRWLVLLEVPASALQDFKPLDGDAGKLLDNMLRAAKLHTAASVLLAPLVRNASIGASGDLPAALTQLLASAKADVVLVMGRLAAQALLQSSEPLAKLRGQIHAVQGQSVIITIDPAYLLRNPLDKAKAWDDLCLAISVASAS